MSRLLFLLGGTALGLIAPKVAKLARDYYRENASSPDSKLFRKRRCHWKTSDQARKEAEDASPGTPGEPSEDALGTPPGGPAEEPAT
jgi:hypothetical protein